eukprot:6077744-Amphidinium_carterae.1
MHALSAQVPLRGTCAAAHGGGRSHVKSRSMWPVARHVLCSVVVVLQLALLQQPQALAWGEILVDAADTWQEGTQDGVLLEKYRRLVNCEDTVWNAFRKKFNAHMGSGRWHKALRRNTSVTRAEILREEVDWLYEPDVWPLVLLAQTRLDAWVERSDKLGSDHMHDSIQNLV